MCGRSNRSYEILNGETAEHANEKHNNSPKHKENKAEFETRIKSFTHGKDHN